MKPDIVDDEPEIDRDKWSAMTEYWDKRFRNILRELIRTVPVVPPWVEPPKEKMRSKEDRERIIRDVLSNDILDLDDDAY